MLYRVLRKLSTGHEKGDLVDGSRFKQLEVLVGAGALSAVKPPPLSELPGWTTRAEQLEPYNIITVNDFLEADDELLREALNYKTLRNINRWRGELKEWLVVDGPKKTG